MGQAKEHPLQHHSILLSILEILDSCSFLYGIFSHILINL